MQLGGDVDKRSFDFMSNLIKWKNKASETEEESQVRLTNVQFFHTVQSKISYNLILGRSR